MTATYQTLTPRQARRLAAANPMALMHSYRRELYHPTALSKAIHAHSITNSRMDALKTARRGLIGLVLCCVTPAGCAKLIHHLQRRRTLHRSMIDALGKEQMAIGPALESATGRSAWRDMDIDRHLAEIDRDQKAGRYYMIDVARVDREQINQTNNAVWPQRLYQMSHAFTRSRMWKLYTARTWLTPH